MNFCVPSISYLCSLISVSAFQNEKVEVIRFSIDRSRNDPLSVLTPTNFDFVCIKFMRRLGSMTLWQLAFPRGATRLSDRENYKWDKKCR